MKPHFTAIAAGLLLVAFAAAGPSCAPRTPVEPAAQPTALEAQRARAAEEGPDRTLEQVRLASLALAAGDRELAEQALRQAVVRMQDFRAEGQFRATVGAEQAKEWKGDPYEKMMAFLYLGILLYEDGQYGNALAMGKSAVLADTGTSAERYRSDFVPAFVLQGLAFEALGERTNAERAMKQAVNALWMRAMVDHLTAILAETKSERSAADDAARLLLLAGLPAGLTAHPRDPAAAIDGALSWASDAWRVSVDAKRRDWPDALTGVRRGDLRAAFDHLEPLARRWQEGLQALPEDVTTSLASDEAFLMSLLDDPGLLVWIERGVGPTKYAVGQYGHVLQIRPRREGTLPDVRLDGRPLRAHYVDSVSFQAQTRGSRRVDGFLRGKAVFKDSSFVLGWALLEAGDVALAVDDDHPAAAVFYALGAATWIAGAVTNPRADTRQWEHLPDNLWLVRADPTPGAHTLTVGEREYTVEIPDHGRVVALLPRLEPGGAERFGTPCRACDVPLAVPQGPGAVPQGPAAAPQGRDPDHVAPPGPEPERGPDTPDDPGLAIPQESP